MCHMSMKLPAMFDENPPHTFDKILFEKTQNNKKPSQSLTFTPNVKVIAEIKANDLGNKKHATKKNEQGVIGVTPTPTPTAVKQYVYPQSTGGLT